MKLSNIRPCFSAITFIFLTSCAAYQPPKEWYIYADINRDSNCYEIQKDEAQSICSKGKYRVMKIYPTKQIFIYSLEPLTDINKCLETGKQKKMVSDETIKH